MRTLSLAMLASLYAQETGDVLVTLVTISHASLPEPIRFCSDYLPGGIPTMSNGNAFKFFPFDVQFPLDRADQDAFGKLMPSNIDRSISDALLAIPPVQRPNVAPTVLIQLVRAVAPDVIEMFFTFALRKPQFDAMNAEISLEYDLFFTEPYPGDTVNPATMPGSFGI